MSANSGGSSNKRQIGDIRKRLMQGDYRDFAEAVADLWPAIYSATSDAYNFQLLVDLLYLQWVMADRPEISIKERDRLSLDVSPYGESAKAVIAKQVSDAEEVVKGA